MSSNSSINNKNDNIEVIAVDSPYKSKEVYYGGALMPGIGGPVVPGMVPPVVPGMVPPVVPGMVPPVVPGMVPPLAHGVPPGIPGIYSNIPAPYVTESSTKGKKGKKAKKDTGPQHHVTRIAQALDANVHPHLSLMNNTAPDRLSNYVNLMSKITPKDKDGKAIPPIALTPHGIIGPAGLAPAVAVPPTTSGILPSHVIPPDLMAPPPPGLYPGMPAPAILPGIGSHPQAPMAVGMGGLTGMPPVTGVPVKHSGTPHNDGLHHHVNIYGGINPPHEHSMTSHY